MFINACVNLQKLQIFKYKMDECSVISDDAFAIMADPSKHISTVDLQFKRQQDIKRKNRKLERQKRKQMTLNNKEKIQNNADHINLGTP